MRRIIEFLAQTADRSEMIALDVTRTSVMMSGGPKETLDDLKDKYGQALGTEIVFAATAGWALGSNARRHDKVAHALTAYISKHPGSYTSKVLSVIRPR